MDVLAQSHGRIAVLGAGGKMGFHVSRMLQQTLRKLGRPETVTAVSRFGQPHAHRRFETAGIQTIAADLCDPAAVRELPDFETLFFLAGVKFGTGDRPDLLRQFNSEMPGLVADRFRESKIVALSSGCVYSFTTPESGGSTEDDETNPPGAYAESCQAREAAFASAARKFGTRIALLRLNYSIDLRYGVLVDIAQQVLSQQPISLCMPCVNVIWQGDAIAHTVQALAHCSTAPFVVNVTGAETLRVRDIATRFAGLFETDVSFQDDEQPTAWLSNASKAHALFGFPKVSPDQMIDWTADWLRRGQPVMNKPTRFQVRDGRY